MSDEQRPTPSGERADVPGAADVPVLPYSPGTRNDFAPPLPAIHKFYQQFGMFSFGLAVTAAMCVVGTVVWRGPSTGREGLLQACCFGSIPWVCSVFLAVILMARHQAARTWAVLALAIDALLVGLLYILGT